MSSEGYKTGMKRILLQILLVTLLGLSLNSAALAAAIGLPEENTARIGYLVGVIQFAVDDPDGPTQSEVDIQPITLIYTNWLPHNWRYWAEAYYFSTSLKGNAGEIRQDVSRLGVRLAFQHHLRVGRSSFWVGAGLDISSNEYTTRYSVDSDGFLLNTYADRTDTAWGLNVQIISEWPVANDWDLAAKLEHVFPLSGGITESTLSAGILYRY